MSTKIYNGYEIMIDRATLPQLRDFMSGMQGRIRGICKTLISKKLADISSQVADARILEKKGLSYDKSRKIVGKHDYCTHEDKHESPLYFAHQLLENRYHKIEETGTRDPEFDFEFEVCFLPLGDRTLALLYTEQKAFVRAWEKNPLVRDYHYQNQTDKPDSISEKDWERRKSDWDIALGHNVPAQVGFAMTTFGRYRLPMPTAAEILRKMPAASERSVRISRRVLRDIKLRKEKWKHPHEFAGAFRKVVEWLNEEGKKDVRKLSSEIRGKIKGKLTIKDITAV